MIRSILLVCILTVLSACSTVTLKDRPLSLLVVVSCPGTLGPLRDKSFGTTTLKLEDVIAQYWECYTAVCGKDGHLCKGDPQ